MAAHHGIGRLGRGPAGSLIYRSLARPGFEIAASVYNPFDADYAYPGFGEHVQDVIEQDGRTFGVRLTYRF